jgi:outer membrane protein TolC
MIGLFLASSAFALTLDEAVHRAAEVNPDAVVAELQAQQAHLDAKEQWFGIGLTPELRVSHTWAGASSSTTGALSAKLDVLDPPAYLNAAEHSALATGADWTAKATTLDAQYATAALYYSALAAQASVDAAKQGEAFAKATSDATAARVGAGLESELVGKSAQIGLLQAQAETARAEADLAVARARLSRALEQPVDDLAPADPPALPEPSADSPWLKAYESSVKAAKLAHGQRVAELFPTGNIVASSDLPGLDTWALTVNGTWTFDGLAGPFLRLKSAAIDEKIAKVQYDALKRDYDLGIVSANELARAAAKKAEVGRGREKLADESLQVGQARLAVGLASSLEVLRLQDEAVSARADRVAAELEEALARLEARRLSGVSW